MKDGILRFQEKSRGELIEKILRLERQNEELKQRLLEKERAEARQKELKFERLQKKKKRQQTPGQKPGHAGLTRALPKQMGRVVEQALQICPDCRHPLSPSQEVITHIQEDIVPARSEVTWFKRHRYFCKHCNRMVTAPYAPDEIPNSRIGPNALIHMAILKYHHALPGGKIVDLFADLAGFRISEGAV